MNLTTLFRNITPHLVWGILSFCSFCMFSCSDEIDTPSSSLKLTFIPSIQNFWEPLTRTGSSISSPTDKATLLSNIDGTPLYLHTIYTDSINSLIEKTDRNAPISRSTPIINENEISSIGVLGYSYTTPWDKTQKPDFMYDIAVIKSGAVWSPSKTYYWPGRSYKMNFFAYSPKGNTNYLITDRSFPGPPFFNCTISDNVQDQKDFLLAESGELPGNQNSAINLHFRHVLTAVKFICGDDMKKGIIKSVSLININSHGIYSSGEKKWVSPNNIKTFKQILNKSVQGTNEEKITTESQTFMMIPQKFTSSSSEPKIEIVFNDGQTDHTLTATLVGTEWPIGKTVTYKLSTSSINWTNVFDVNKPADFGYYGGTNIYKVASYRVNTKGDVQPIPWSTQFSEDNGNTWSTNVPSWLTNFTASSTGSGKTPISYYATAKPQAYLDTSPHTIILKKALPHGSESQPWNLSNPNGIAKVQETANCYIVNSAGYYSIPLVYGNAITNGTTNRSAYYSTATSWSNPILKEFVNHLGNPITDPYIANNSGCIPDHAELVWQDAPELLTNIKYIKGTNGGSITFKVDPSTLREGNAVIAIKDATNNILWSWQIWVSDVNLSITKRVINDKNEQYDLMTAPIGWCDINTISYAERSFMVKFIAGNQVKVFTINQTPTKYIYGQNCSLYQWGRKDPFIPGFNHYTMKAENKRWYDKSGILHTNDPGTELFPTNDCIKLTINKPYIFNTNEEMDGDNCNTWNTNNNTYYYTNNPPVIKTIYDPSPVGFHVPGPNAFTGFTTTGGRAQRIEEINGIWNDVLDGYDFYCDNTKRETILFYSTGARMLFIGTSGSDDGEYWTSAPSNEFGFKHRAYLLYFINKTYHVDTHKYQPRGSGYAVWAVKN